MLVDNINFTRKHFPSLRDLMKKYEQRESNIEVLSSNSGFPTIRVMIGNKPQFVHSKYDPQNEAEMIANQVLEKIINMEKDDQPYSHILFYGIGMGYHIEKVLKKLPDIHYSIYEPKPEILYHSLSHRLIENYFTKQLKNFFLEMKGEDVEKHLQDFISQNNDRVLLVSLPSYERIYKEDYEKFLVTFKERVVTNRSNLHTNLNFEKRWVINSFKNFPSIMKTPNILQSLNKRIFKNKPVVLVAAGPSLEEELENIRYIKNNGLAYIFSVGSAIKALLKNSIYPDCVLSYDPGEFTKMTYTELNEQKIDSIPLIFGSTVGFETVSEFIGPKLHVITSQDRVAPLFVDIQNNNIETINDAPSIAVITLQLLCKLGANPIILVGQNFAYKNQQYYTSGISYGKAIDENLKQRITSSNIVVESVDGEMIHTENIFNVMRHEMEYYINEYSNKIEVLNTTKGGAKISGTKFIKLNEIIYDLKTPIVEKEWFINYTQYKDKTGYLMEMLNKYNANLKEINKEIIKLTNTLQKIQSKIGSKNIKVISTALNSLDREFHNLTGNPFFNHFLLPMNRIRYEIMVKDLKKTNMLTNQFDRVEKILNTITAFVFCCKCDLEIVESLFNELIQAINLD